MEMACVARCCHERAPSGWINFYHFATFYVYGIWFGMFVGTRVYELVTMRLGQPESLYLELVVVAAAGSIAFDVDLFPIV